MLYGDYDVDGVTSLTILRRPAAGLRRERRMLFAACAMEEGYGLSAEGVVRCMETLRPQLLIAIDCGTASVSEIATLRAAGVDVLVFDHHEPQAVLPGLQRAGQPEARATITTTCAARA